MWSKLESLRGRLPELEQLQADPAILGNHREMQRVGREMAELRPVIEAYDQYLKTQAELKENKEMFNAEKDPEMRIMARDEVTRLTAELERIEAEIRVLLLPRDPNDDKNILIEIRAGAGGEEAALFAAELFRAYSMYAGTRGWKVEILSHNDTGIGGLREVIAMIEGKGAYSRLKYESGVHRVQRVPATETSGRIHTSTITVCVIAEAEEVDVQLNADDLRIDVFRSSGPGGQSVNTTDSACRITHIPSGLVVQCQDEKSQLKNKNKAMKILRSRLLDQEQAKAAAERADMRKSQIGTGDRSERIRTYNFPQNRVSDHRIGLTVHNLPAVMDGGFEPFIEALIAQMQMDAMKQVQDS